MSDDLVRRLAFPYPKDEDVEEVTLPVWVLELTTEAADRIEELEAELSNVKLELNGAVKLLTAAGDGLRLMVRVEMAEAKLEVAVEAFTDLEQDCEADYPPSHGAMKYYIQRALAELKGEQP